jgi:hypothetical protein
MEMLLVVEADAWEKRFWNKAIKFVGELRGGDRALD